ncbi:aldo/keto reductase [candidate division KSB1 bacterium]|nr:aldo/keto reductase [candidate division KSB1 bacterium]
MHYNRRLFLKSMAGIIGSSFIPRHLYAQKEADLVDRVALGDSGLQVSRLALGTGTHGWKNRSDQTKLGFKGFNDLAAFAYDHGVTFLDVADIYGSHHYVKKLWNVIPRDKFTIMSKVWTQPNNWLQVKDANAALDRFRKEMNVDMIDLVLMHSQVDVQWDKKYESWLEQLSRAKEKGIIRAHGVSCHSLEALKRASELSWVDVILARINYNGDRMDGDPSVIMPILAKMHAQGKGVIGMKIFGCGNLVKDEQREKSLRYVLKSGNVDAMTIGFVAPEQIVDTIKRVNHIVG